MDKRKTYAQTVAMEEKKIIWELYFYKFYKYDDLLTHFQGKYTYAQLKSIIIEKLKLEQERDKQRNGISK